MTTRRYTLLDVFSDTPLAGNGLAVVHDADALDDATMLAFAQEMRLSETTFVQTATEDGADYRNRIWMTTVELPFAGHPSLGTAVAVAHERGETSVRYVQQTGSGLQPIEVEFSGSGRARATMLQEPPTYGDELDRAETLAAVGLPPEAGHPELPPQVVDTGLTHVILPLRDMDALQALVTDDPALDPLLDGVGATTVHATVIDGDAARSRGFMRMGEDPATGSAAGPLMAYVVQRLGSERLTITQGVEMGRPSTMYAEWADDRPRVGGDCVVLIDGQVHLDT